MTTPFILGILTAFAAEFAAVFVTVLIIAVIRTVKEAGNK